MAIISYADLDVRAGNTFDPEFQFLQEDGTPEDLTGAKFVLTAAWGSFSIRYASDDVSPKVTLPGDGKVKIHVLPSVTDDWPAENIPYELERWEDDDQWTYVEGTLKVTRKVNDNVDP